MKEPIGKIIKRIAESQGVSQEQLGTSINRSKQTVSNIYKRSTIDTELLKSISKTLNHDFLSYYYQEEPYKSFRDEQEEIWIEKLETLKRESDLKDKIISNLEEMLIVQRKLIAKLEK